jgi:hypothetical protein
VDVLYVNFGTPNKPRSFPSRPGTGQLYVRLIPVHAVYTFNNVAGPLISFNRVEVNECTYGFIRKFLEAVHSKLGGISLCEVL